MKKIKTFILLLAMTLVCFAFDYTDVKAADIDNVSVNVPARIDIVFNEDGTASLNIIEGDHTEEIKGNWKVDAGVYTFTVFESEELSVVYDPLTDTLVRVIQDNAPDAQYSMVQFTYTRR